MKNVSILIPETAVIEAVADPFQIFKAVNRFLEASGKPPLFDVQLVGLTQEVKLENSHFSVHADKLLGEVKKTDLIFIPALSGDIPKAIDANKDFIPWLVLQYQAGAEIASLCLGAFLLGATGLLDNKKCSTHWLFANEFRTMFPNIDLVDGSIITE